MKLRDRGDSQKKNEVGKKEQNKKEPITDKNARKYAEEQVNKNNKRPGRAKRK